MKNNFKLILLTVISILISCAKKDPGTSTGNPVVNLSMTSSNSVATVATNFYNRIFSLLIPTTQAKLPPSLMSDSQANSITISSFWVSLGEIELKANEVAEASESESAEISFTGPYNIDMLSDTPSSFTTGSIPLSSFRRLKYKFKKILSLPDSAPAGVLNKAVYISGSVNGKPFIFSSSSEIEMSIAGSNAVGAEDSATILIQVQIANLIKKINFSAVTAVTTTDINEGNRLTSGTAICPQIDNSLTDVYNCVLKGLSTEANLGKDVNKDGSLDNDEPSVK